MRAQTSSRPWQSWQVPAIVVAITFVAFLPALTADFVAWDDQANFLENVHYRGLGLANLKWMWSTFLLGHYVPLSWMTLGADYLVWGMNARGYHLTSLLIHCGDALLMYFFARRVLAACDLPAIREDDRVLQLASALAALLFAVHPLRVESVAWVTERRDVLSALFYLATLLCYLRAVETPALNRRWYAIAIACFVAALLSKGTAVTLPAVLLILNVYPLRRAHVGSAKQLATELAPFVLLSAGFTALTFVALQPMPQLPVPAKIAVSAFSLSFYLLKTILPTGLAPLYDIPLGIDPLARGYVGCYVVCVLFLAGAYLARRKLPGLTAAMIAFVVILFPLLGIHQNGPQIAADRYTYNAAPALAIALAAGWASLRRPLSRGPIISAAAIVLALAAGAWSQSRIWHDSVRMWSSVLELAPNSSVTLTALGNLEMKAGRPDSAIAFFRKSLSIDPYSPEAENNIAIALSHVGKLDEAAGHFAKAIHLKPTDYEAHNNLGLTIANLGGSLDEAISHYREAIRLKADYSTPHVNWGNALVMSGNIAGAIAQYEEAIRFDPANADAHRNWGVALARRGDYAGAADHFRKALQLRPDFDDVRRMLSQVVPLLSR